MPWSCEKCTYFHQSQKETQYLSCCICGSKREVFGTKIDSNNTKTTQIVKKSKKRKRKLIDLTEQSTVLDLTGTNIKGKKKQKLQIHCKIKEKSHKDWKIASLDDVALRLPVKFIPNVVSESFSNLILEKLLRRSAIWDTGTWNINNKAHVLDRKYKIYTLPADVKNKKFSPLPSSSNSLFCFSSQSEEETAFKELRHLCKKLTEKVNQVLKTNWCPTYTLCNYYENETKVLGLHSDQLHRIGPRPIIISYSLGATRRFDLISNEKSKPSLQIHLPHNSALIMYKDAQENYKHGIPKSSFGGKDNFIVSHDIARNTRISLTLRKEITNLMTPPKCYCGVPSSLKYINGKYMFLCKPINTDKHCNFFRTCHEARIIARQRLNAGF